MISVRVDLDADGFVAREIRDDGFGRVVHVGDEFAHADNYQDFSRLLGFSLQQMENERREREEPKC